VRSGVALALSGPWLLPTFLGKGDPHAAAVVGLASLLLWIAAAYQVFDALNIGSGFALRGAGDVRAPAVLFFVLSWFVFVPLSHSLSFAPGEGGSTCCRSSASAPSAAGPRSSSTSCCSGRRCGWLALARVGAGANLKKVVGGQ
jgi:Na+-driven multidrug efflux pump